MQIPVDWIRQRGPHKGFDFSIVVRMQTQDSVKQILVRLSGVSDIYNRLVLVVGPAGSGKTSALRALAAQEDRPLISMGVELSRRLLDLTERQRVLQLPRLLEEIVLEKGPEPTIFDNTEILFNPVLKQDPLRLLQSLSRNRTIVASWLGTVAGTQLTYGTPEHPEFRRYATEGLLLVDLEDSSGETLSQEKAGR